MTPLLILALLLTLALIAIVAIGLGFALFFSTIQTFDVNVKIDDTGDIL